MTSEQQEAAAPSLEQQAANMKSWAEYLRGQVQVAFDTARQAGQPHTWRLALEQVRGHQDRLEQYLALAITQKGALGRMAADARHRYDEVWAQQADGNSKTGVRRGEEFEGARERYARFDVQVFPQLREWRQAEQRLSLFSEVLDELWLRYRAVNATREDIHQILRAYAFEQALERT